ncbi:MAG TPA: NAD(P)H-dependent oxidoreductase [Candidatus Dorea intestinavium]|nr:NAD(P)H-dependent oxidoreductase [Candidatus Dorea intestinavium]
MNKMSKKIVAIVGSLRKESLNKKLALKAKEIVGEEAEFEILEYSDIPFMNEDIEFPAPKEIERIRKQIKEADGIWIFTPEYNHFFSGVLKNLLDWMSRPVSKTEGNVLEGKPVALSGMSPGMSGTILAQDNLVTLLSFLNMDIMNAPRLIIPRASTLVNEGVLELGNSEKYLIRQKDAFLKYLDK